MCGFTYRRTRRWPWRASSSRRAGSGTIRHVRAQYLQDWLRDANAPMTWRLDKSKAGSGALGDIGAHSIDTTQWFTGQSITGVSAMLETFVTSGPERDETVGLGGHGDERAARGRHGRRRGAVHRPASTVARSASSRRPASPWAARTRSGSR